MMLSIESVFNNGGAQSLLFDRLNFITSNRNYFPWLILMNK